MKTEAGKLFWKLGLVVLGALVAAKAMAVPLVADSTLTNPDEGLSPGPGGYFTSPASPVAIGGGLYGGVTSLLADQVNPMIGDFSGNVRSWVYGDDPAMTTQMLFVYRFAMDQDSGEPDLIRATISDQSHPWAGISITDAGSDNSGLSGAGGSEINDEWHDGDPNFLLRDPPGQEGISIQWRVVGGGTTLQESDTSALIWLLTEADTFISTSVALIDSGATGKSIAFAPQTRSVPAPGTAALLLLALAILIPLGVRSRIRGNE